MNEEHTFVCVCVLPFSEFCDSELLEVLEWSKKEKKEFKVSNVNMAELWWD